MKGWKEVKVSDLGKVITGNTPPRKNPELYGNHTIFIKPTDVSEDSKYTFNPEECYSELGYNKYRNSLIPKGSTCVVTIGSIGKKMTKAHCPCFINQAMNAITPYPEYDEEFVYYLLRYNLNQIKSLDSGTASGRENVSKSSFSSIKVNVPTDKLIQTKIGKILSTYDDFIENNNKRIKLLEEAAQRTYEEWFVRLTINGEKLAINENTGLPDGWEDKKLENTIVFLSRGISPEYVKENGIKVVNQRCIRSGVISLTQSRLTSKSTKISHEKYVKLYDILINSTGAGTLGRVAQVINEDLFTVDSHITILRADPAIISPLILGIAMMLKEEFITSLGKGSTNQLELSRTDLKNLIKIVVPNKSVQDKFDLIVIPIVQQLANLSNQNLSLKKLRDILLPKLMNGTIDLDKTEKNITSIAAEPEIFYS